MAAPPIKDAHSKISGGKPLQKERTINEPIFSHLASPSGAKQEVFYVHLASRRT